MAASGSGDGKEDGEAEGLRSHAANVEDQNGRLRRYFDSSDQTIAVFDRGVLVEINPRIRVMFGYEVHEALGRPALEFVAPSSRELVGHNIRTGVETPYEGLALHKDGTEFPVEFHGRTVTFEGRPARMTMVTDLTTRKRAEAASQKAAVQAEMIRAQAELVAALSTPVLPIAEDVIMVPIVGPMNEARGEELLGALLGGIAARGAHTAILDVTGVPNVDAGALDALGRAAHAARLLGARVLLSGLRAEVARAFAAREIDLGGIEPCATLTQAVARALPVRRRTR